MAEVGDEVVVRVAVVGLGVRGFGVLYGAALILGGLAWVLVGLFGSVFASFGSGRACPQVGVSVMVTSCGCSGEGLLWSLGSPLRLRFWPAIVVWREQRSESLVLV